MREDQHWGPGGELGERDRGGQDPGDPELPSSTVQALPVRVVPADLEGERTYQYWPFSTSDLYNWKTQNPPFSEKPQGLIDLLDSILFTHNPTWDDCQQLLQVLFTTEEREQILAEAWKRVLGADGRPTAQPHLVDEGFPLLRPNWDFQRAEGRQDWTLGSLQSHAASHTGRTGKSTSRMEGESSPIKSFEIETCPPGGLLILLLMAALINPGATSHNPHQPAKITWKLNDGQTHELLNETSGIHPPNTWWPDLYFSLSGLFAKQDGLYDKYYRDGIENHRLGFWACPGNISNNWKTCGGIGSYYCRSWSCVTSCDGPQRWDVGNRDLVNFTFNDHRHQGPQVRVQFNQERAKKENHWTSGLTWGFQLHVNWPGPYPGELLIIKQVIEPVQVHSLGPNLVETSQGHKATPKPTTSRPSSPRTFNISSTLSLGGNLTETLGPLTVTTSSAIQDSLWALVNAAFTVLNHTNPNATQSCWLCYNLRPPFYEAIGLNVSYNLSSGQNPPQCRWEERKVGLTMNEVWGQGLCLGTVPHDKAPLCAQTIGNLRLHGKNWIVPEVGGWWICSHTGLTPCLNVKVFNQSQEFCVLVAVMPKILYHSKEVMYSHWDREMLRQKREPISAITMATLFSLGLAGAGTRIASLSLQGQGFSSLRAAIDEDITRIEESISHLEKSLSSLSEVVLQNRRRLDLIFLQQGGVCAALGEECCFYADHTGVVRESMAKVREGLAQRKREEEAQQGWFESWFQRSPWLTTLVSTLLGPLIVLLLILTFGPCILNWLMSFIKERLNTIQIMVLRQQYQMVAQDEEKDSSTETTRQGGM